MMAAGRRTEGPLVSFGGALRHGHRPFAVLPKLPALLLVASLLEGVDGDTGASHGANLARAQAAAADGKHALEAEADKPSGWFGAFSEGESSYDEDALGTAHRDVNPMVDVMDGWNPDTSSNDPLAWIKGRTKGSLAIAYHESPSAGAEQAWQTHWPAMQSSVGSGAGTGANGEWYQGAGGSWNQAYKSSRGGRNGAVKPADWFDASVDQVDGYGRPKEPWSGSGRRYMLWEERAVNTTLTCADAGCIASTVLQAFDGTKEQASRCRFSLGVHATDFDYDDSGEFVEYVKVNGVTVSSMCKPLASGCSNMGQGGKALYPCVADLDISSIISWTGALKIEAKIPYAVDECAYEGNLLSVVPVVTCLVLPQDPSPMIDGAPNSGDSIYEGFGVISDMPPTTPSVSLLGEADSPEARVGRLRGLGASALRHVLAPGVA